MLNKEFYYLCLSGRKSCAEKKNPVSAILRDGIIEGCMFCLGLILFLNPRLSAGVIDVNGWMVYRDAIFFLCVYVRSFVSVKLLRIFRSKEYPFRLYLTTMKSIRRMFF